VTCTASYTITQADLDAGSVNNSATAHAGGVNSTPATATVTAIQNKSISLTKAANPTTYNTVGQTITYTYTIKNTSNIDLPGPFTVSDNKVASVTCASGPLAPGASLNCTGTYTITQADLNAGSVTNIATASTIYNGSTVTSNQATATITSTGVINTGAIATYTQGGWGAKPAGGNPGALLKANFSKVYGAAGVTIGGGFTLTFTSQVAIQNFLPQGGTPGVLTATATNPTSSSAQVFAGQVLALQLSVDFSKAGITGSGLGGLYLTAGPLAGQTVAQVLAEANTALGGGALPAGITKISDLNDVVDKINNSFDDAVANGYVK